jgi:transcriptional regulator with XRE-family HTH domain
MMNDKVLLRIARKIRTARQARSLTVQQVATLSKVSKGLLSKIENGRTIPSLPVFISVIHSLEMSLKDFFEDITIMHDKNYLLIRKEQFAAFEKEERKGFNYRNILSQWIPSSLVEASILTVEPFAKSLPVTTEGFEFKYLISGECNYLIQDEMIFLNEGDALYFDGTTPHVPVNSSDRKAIMLVIYFITRTN